MQLIVLGSGTSVPHSQRASAAFWLETESGSMLLDCSADAMHRMAEENHSVGIDVEPALAFTNDIGNVFIAFAQAPAIVRVLVPGR